MSSGSQNGELRDCADRGRCGRYQGALVRHDPPGYHYPVNEADSLVDPHVFTPELSTHDMNTHLIVSETLSNLTL